MELPLQSARKGRYSVPGRGGLKLAGLLNPFSHVWLRRVSASFWRLTSRPASRRADTAAAAPSP